MIIFSFRRGLTCPGYEGCGALRFRLAGAGVRGLDSGHPMKFTVSKQFSFEAAHSLPHLPVGHKCRNIHGHSYVVEIYCTGPLDERGFVMDFAELSAAMKPLVERLDHQNLNDVLPVASTAENLGAWIMEQLTPQLPMLSRVDVRETARTCARVDR